MYKAYERFLSGATYGSTDELFRGCKIVCEVKTLNEQMNAMSLHVSMFKLYWILVEEAVFGHISLTTIDFTHIIELVVKYVIVTVNCRLGVLVLYCFLPFQITLKQHQTHHVFLPIVRSQEKLEELLHSELFQILNRKICKTNLSCKR